MKVWYVYILECSDGTLYTGITNDLDKRIAAHNAGKGAKYTKGRRPVNVIWCNLESSKSDALKFENKIKKMTRKEKISAADYWREGGRMTLYTAMQILKEEGWTTNGEVAKNSDPTNNSTYVIWNKGNDVVYLGDFFLESDKYGVSFPWAQLTGSNKVKTRKELIAFLNGDMKTAFGK